LDALAEAPPDRLVITGTGKIFIAGADIREIERITRREAPPDLGYLNALLAQIEDFPAPVVMALNGAALGIGLETALAGHYRVMAQSAIAGLPEVKLGLIPGAGGTQRLPRLVGLARAVAMIESGLPLNATEAFDAGLVDDVAPDADLLRVALESRAERRRTSDLPLIATRAAQAVLAAYAAPDFATGLAAEADLFRQALHAPEAKAMVYLFFAERDAAKLPGSLPTGAEPPQLLPSPNGRTVEVVYSEATDGAELARIHAQLRREQKLPILTREPLAARLETAVLSGDSQVVRQMAEQLQNEGVIARISDIDVLFVHGYGYPAEQGGPVFQAYV
jgi:enoyl-CoA hydratase/carnithine racemase